MSKELDNNLEIFEDKNKRVQIEKPNMIKIFFYVFKNKLIDIFKLAFCVYIMLNIFFQIIFGIEIYLIEVNKKINIFSLIIIFLIATSILSFIYIKIKFFKLLPDILLFSSAFIFAVLSVINRNLNITFNIVILVVLFFIINSCFNEKAIVIPENFLKTRYAVLILIIFCIAYLAVIGLSLVLKYKTYRNSTFDFGIFAQMFENMARTGFPITTVERNVELSHFAVHFSPFYYLLLPFYMLYRSPETLIVIQIFFVTASVIPLYLITKKLEFTDTQALLASLTLLFYPSVTGGLFFDFHENKFLLFFILWVFYFLLNDKLIFVAIFSVITLTIKEDSFLYILFIALYMITLKGKKKKIYGASLTVFSILYFMLAVTIIESFGRGVMIYRYDLYLIPGEEGFTNIIINILKNPSLFLSTILSNDKLFFSLYMFLPLCFIPFITKKINNLILLIPFIIMNLATNYVYQFDINFQYTYGSAALLFFLFLINLKKLNKDLINKLLISCACFSIILFMSNNLNKVHSQNFIYWNFKSEFIENDAILAKIPEDASVSASTFIVPHLVRHKELYNVDLFDVNYFAYDTEYMINDLRSIDFVKYKDTVDTLHELGYIKVDSGKNIEVYKKQTVN